MSSAFFPSPPPPYSGSDEETTGLVPSLIIISGLLSFVVVASLSIQALLRFLSARSEARDGDSRPPSPLPQTHHPRGGDDDGAADAKKALIESLPRFTMASALAALPRSSPDCAVCLSPFTPDAELRLLPACRHAFHAECVDAWLCTTPTCPLCRAVVALPHPSISALLAAQQSPPPSPEPAPSRSSDRSTRFRVEMGSVSSRGSPASSTGTDDSRTYSLGSFEYHIDEEVEAVVSSVESAAAIDDTVKEEKPAAEGSPLPPGEAVAEAAGSPARGWLREYLDRLASSASSFSGRWSSRWSQSQQGHRQDEPWLWDAEAATVPPPPPPPPPGSDEEMETAFMVLYRWIAAI